METKVAKKEKKEPKSKTPSKQATKKETSSARKKADSKTLLTKVQKHQIVLDIEKHPGCQFKHLLEKYPEVYRVGDQVQTAYRNRFHYLKDLKETKPVEYWKLYTKAGNIVLAGEADGDQDEDEEESIVDDEDLVPNPNEEEDDPDTDDEPKTVISELTTPVIKPKKQKKMSAAKGSKARSGGSSITKFGSPSASGRVATTTRWSTVSEAKSFADETITVDFDFPEKNGGPLFWCQLINECETEDGKEMFDKVVLRLSSCLDLSDAHKIFGWLCAEGRVFMVKIAWAPNFMLEHHEKMFKREKKKCKRTKNKHAAAANAILILREER